MDRFYERHQDYVFDIGNIFSSNSIGTLNAGQQYTGLGLTLDADAPFVLRSIAVRMQWDLSVGQQNLKYLFFRWKRANGDFLSSQAAWIPFLEFTGNYGQGGNPYPIWPPEIYPRQGVIEIDLWNNNALSVNLAGVQIVARGVKLFPPRECLYPKKYRWLNYGHSVKPTSVGINSSIPSFVIPPVQDSDWVLRKLQAGCIYNDQAPSTFFGARNVWVLLRDQDGHGYANLGVDWNILAGASYGAYPTGSFPDKEQTGPFHPGLFYSEIYVPRLQPLLMDITRNDSVYAGPPAGIAPVRLDFAFMGGKVFQA